MKTDYLRWLKLPGIIANIPVIYWALLGIILSYFLFFVWPVFLNQQQEMQFPSYIPVMNPIGTDSRMMVIFAKKWFLEHQSLYGGVCATPISILFFAPLMYLSDSQAYYIMAVIIVLVYLFNSLIFPALFVRTRTLSPLVVLISVVGLFSFGLQFEIERGQFYSIAMFFCCMAVYLYQKNKYVFLSYILLSIAIQLKLSPAVFLAMYALCDNKRKGIINILLLLLVNVMLLMVFGWGHFKLYVLGIAGRLVSPYITIYNHSIRDFLFYFSKKYPGMTEYAGFIELVFMIVFVLLTLLVICSFYWVRQDWIRYYLFFICVIGMMTIPAESFDYNLAILSAPVAIFLCYIEKYTSDLFHKFVALGISFCYGMTLFSFTNKDPILKNNFPVLIAMLVLLYISFIVVLLYGRKKLLYDES
ncbi:MAG: glycosyltransferase family 87 protein [Planctomycetota bacterium]